MSVYKPERTTLVLGNQHNAWLDEQAAAIRRESGAVVNRSQILRGMIRGIANSGVDLSRCQSEKDVTELISYVLSVRSGIKA